MELPTLLLDARHKDGKRTIRALKIGRAASGALELVILLERPPDHAGGVAVPEDERLPLQKLSTKWPMSEMLHISGQSSASHTVSMQILTQHVQRKPQAAAMQAFSAALSKLQRDEAAGEYEPAVPTSESVVGEHRDHYRAASRPKKRPFSLASRLGGHKARSTMPAAPSAPSAPVTQAASTPALGASIKFNQGPSRMWGKSKTGGSAGQRRRGA